MTITQQQIRRYAEHLSSAGYKSTVEYVRYAKRFADFAGERELTAELLAEYRKQLSSIYNNPISANSAVSYTNSLLRYLGNAEYRLPYFDVDRRGYENTIPTLTESELDRLLEYAGANGREKTGLIIRVMARTGLRSAELRYVTAETLLRGSAEVLYYGKTRNVVFPADLCEELLTFAKKLNISQGAVFVTKRGQPYNRNRIFSEFRALSEAMGFPREILSS